MKNIRINMANTKLYLLAITLFALITVTSCGDSDDNASTPKDETIAALEGTWSLSSESTLANTGVDPSSVSVTFSETGFTISGGLSSYVSGGSYTIDDSGSLTSPSVTIASSDLALDGTPTISMDGAMSKITISFSTIEASGRISGLGNFVLIFVKQ